MKEQKILSAIGLMDEKYIEEADFRHIKKIWIWSGMAAACVCLVCISVYIALFIPRNGYSGSEYAPIIHELYKYFEREENKVPSSNPNPILGLESIEDDQQYVETTDNQEKNVLEADLIKRSDRYIYYLDKDVRYSFQNPDPPTLRIFEINGENTVEIGSYECAGAVEMYLSQDCRTVTLIQSAGDLDWRSATQVVTLDVSDPTNIKKINSIKMSGGYVTSRFINGSLFMFNMLSVPKLPTESDRWRERWEEMNLKYFIPHIDTGDGAKPFPLQSIVTNDLVTNNSYAIIVQLDAQTLQVKDLLAILSGSAEVYMSENMIYTTMNYGEDGLNAVAHGNYGFSQSRTAKQFLIQKQNSVTRITGIRYNDQGMEVVGTAMVAGYVKDQYSMDEKDGVLRIVTTSRMSDGKTSADLYCISSDTWEEIASVKQFAPAGETVRSARFDGDKVYVCTATEWLDPVFCFDLSDLSHITYTDTGTVPGFSNTLIDFKDGYLLGIGEDENVLLKLEIYTANETKVESVCVKKYPQCYPPEQYKAYFIDRERGLIGMAVSDHSQEEPNRYILWQFDGEELHEIINVHLYAISKYARALYIDGYFYMFGHCVLKVVQLDQ